jgi:hypothetical protein
MWALFRRKSREDPVEYPRIAKIKIHPLCCHTCGESLKDGDLAVWSEKKNGWKGEMSHARCVVFIRHTDSSTTRLDGRSIRTDGRGGILEPLPKGSLLLTVSEWEHWSNMAD